MPYATIIIPTHSRASTLALSVRSALNQSIRDIEVIIAGDGVTEAVRNVAEGLSNSDGRVRFIDRPKSPGSGAANRDYAVRNARAEYIFYNDDDDLLLPHHVETLGKELEWVHVVDTPVVSIVPEGLVSLGVHNSGSALQRALLRKGRFKAVFDSHLAHRKSTYISLGNAWRATGKDVVENMLQTFAKDSAVRWSTIPRITALSFHGATRVAMSPEERTNELDEWSRWLGVPEAEGYLARSGGYCFHGLRLLRKFRFLRPENTRQLLEKIGAHTGGMSSQSWAKRGWLASLLFDFRNSQGDAFEIDMQYSQMSSLDALIAVYNRKRPEVDDFVRALNEILHPALGPVYGIRKIVRQLISVYTDTEIRDLIGQLPAGPSTQLLECHVAIVSGDHSGLARNASQLLENAPGYRRFFLGYSVAEALWKAGSTQEAWRLTERIKQAAPERHTMSFWKMRMQIARKLGKVSAVDEANVRMAMLNAM